MPWTKQFDPQDALRRAMLVFWTHGYEGTSLSNLLQAMSIQKGSFYDTYGSKHELYLKAMELYLQERFAGFERITENREPKEALLAVLDAIRKECVGKEREKSCLALNCVLERAQSDPAALKIVQQAFKFQEKFYASLIREGQQAGTISSEIDPSEASKVLMGLVMAMRVYGKARAPASTINTLFAQMKVVLEGP